MISLANPLVTTLINLKGNARGAVFTEALWGIPFNLYSPYVSVYMVALGLTDMQIGLIATIGLVGQIFFSLLGGVITDKYGRKRTTFYADFVCWSIPCIVWAVSQNFYYFVVAALINSAWRISATSWGCILVEDTDPDLLMDIYSWIYIAGQGSTFFAPIAGLLIHQYSLVPTMRGLYVFSFVMMTAKFVVMNAMATETRQGMVRLAETKHQSLFQILAEYRNVLKALLGTRQTLYTIGIMMVMGITSLVNGTFWAILVTERLQIPAQYISIYPFAKSIATLIFFFVAMPRVRDMHFRNPMLVGFAGFIISQVMLITIPEKSYVLLLISALLDACCVAIVGTQVDRMFVVTVDAQDRARIMSLVYAVVIAVTSPFGWISGTLSGINKTYPFILNLGLFAVGAFLVYRAAIYSNRKRDEQQVAFE
jgi:MFS family permease